MRIGVVCEGPTDWYAIVCFLEASLSHRGIAPIFVPLQPEMDNTSRTEGGWGAVLNWLMSTPPKTRTASYFDGGLFGDDMSAKQCDTMVFQMDADILSDCAFQKWIKSNLCHDVDNSQYSVERGNEIRTIIEIAGKFPELSTTDSNRQIPAPAVESTETWCVASSRVLSDDPEALSGIDLCREFMTALHRSENRLVQQFAKIDKQPDRRRRYCEKQSSGFERLEAQCLHYRELVDSICRWSDSR